MANESFRIPSRISFDLASPPLPLSPPLFLLPESQNLACGNSFARACAIYKSRFRFTRSTRVIESDDKFLASVAGHVIFLDQI